MHNKTLPFPFIEPETVDLELLMYAMDTFAGTNMVETWKEKEWKRAEKKGKMSDL